MHLVLTALTGALMVGLADFAGRAAFAPIQIPAGLVTAIVGVPVFVALILRTQARSQL
ncbi:MAG: iron chelate uptake ABC transporter family permease subunit [Pseudomonadota bacterium]